MQDILSLERKLKMYEAREAVLSRIGSETFSVIDLNNFLRATVNEIGKMMRVDRCDVMTLAPDGKLRITHEYRVDVHDLPSSLGIEIDFDRLQESFDFHSIKAIEDTATAELPHTIRAVAERLHTRSLLIVPITFNLKLLGTVLLHRCREHYLWQEDEISFVASLAEQIAIGFRYTQIYSEKEHEARINKALLEIANDINTGNEFSEITEHILDRAIDLLGIEAACLAVLDSKEIHFTNLRTAEGVDAAILKRPSLNFPILEFLPKNIEHGQMLKLQSAEQHPYARTFLTEVFTAGACILSPIVVEAKLFGALILLWKNPKAYFTSDESALALGISDQLAIALSKARLSAEVLRLRQELETVQSSHHHSGLVGKSDGIMRCMEMAVYVADSYTTVLIQGESGTGKEVLADLIQSRSSRNAKPYIKINCGAIPESLLESELFGHEKGAFTDARSRRIGKFEEANGGTLFLDEIGEMSLGAQIRLLRVLQNGEIVRVGSNEVIKTDVRVIAATNVDLEEAVREGRFRRDLFYRLNVYPIKLPALRERREDIPLLAIHFLEIYRKRSNKNITGITEKALSRLRRYDWHGNVRELENAIERAVIIAQGNMITVDDLPDAVRGAESEADAKQTLEIEVGTTVDEAEKRLILETLTFNNGDRTRTAQMLGIGRKTLYRKLQQYNAD
ncbi:MAG: sigma 54-interacting transcriptional regulator [Acidobacteriota bacterium]